MKNPGLRWSALALQDLNQALDDAGTVAAVDGLEQALGAATQALLAFPGLGRTGRLVGTREHLLSPLPFVLIYRFNGAVLEVVRLYHVSRRWPPKQGGKNPGR